MNFGSYKPFTRIVIISTRAINMFIRYSTKGDENVRGNVSENAFRNDRTGK